VCGVLQAVADGPRATDRFAAVTAAFVAGLAGSARAPEIAAQFLDALASRMEASVEVCLQMHLETLLLC
jgi:hypothetical protein